MSPTLNHFGRAAEGSIASRGVVTDLAIMGSKPGLETHAILAACIGQGLENGHIELTQAAIDAKAANAVKATPGGGLAATGGETEVYVYNPEKTEGLFTGRQADISLKPPM